MNEAALISRYYANLKGGLGAAKEFGGPEAWPRNRLEEIMMMKAEIPWIVSSITGGVEVLTDYKRQDLIKEAEKEEGITVEGALRKLYDMRRSCGMDKGLPAYQLICDKCGKFRTAKWNTTEEEANKAYIYAFCPKCDNECREIYRLEHILKEMIILQAEVKKLKKKLNAR